MNSTTTAIELASVTKQFGDGQFSKTIIRDLSISFERGRFACIVAPNGAGKTTLLRLISGLESPDAGVINRMTHSPGLMPFVFQDYRASLLPWASVKDNILYPLRLLGVRKRERMDRLERLVSSFGFAFDLNSRAISLSGGEAQTCCLMRALIVEPEIILMDEPLSALDFESQLIMRERIDRMAHVMPNSPTIIIVSHDIEDAVFLADDIFVFSRRPLSLLEAIPVRLSRPRLNGIEVSPEFVDYKRMAVEAFKRSLYYAAPGGEHVAVSHSC